MIRVLFAAALCMGLLPGVTASLYPQSHPHLFFDKTGMDALRERALHDPVLNKMWQKFQEDRAGRAIRLSFEEPFDQDTGRDYGDALADLTIAYIITRDMRYVNKAKSLALDLARAQNWGTSDWEQHLAVAHISIGYAFCWDVLYDHFSSDEKDIILAGARKGAGNLVSSNQLSNHNWTPSAAQGLLALAFRGEVDFDNGELNRAKNNFKDGNQSVLWAHGADGFSPQGLGYWRKYNQVVLFFQALRRKEPENDWFRLGKEYPGSDFFKYNAYPRIYADVQHRDVSCITWGDCQQVGTEAEGPYGCMGMLAFTAAEYRDGYALDFLKTIVNESRYRFEDEDFAAFVLYDDSGVPSRSYRDLPLSRYWPNMEAAIFRSGWDEDDLVFFMRCGSQGGHAAYLKDLARDGHSHPDANGFVLYYNNDYLAAEDGAKPDIGQHAGKRITYGHNTLLVDGRGQKGDRGDRVPSTNVDMDYLDADHVGYLLGNATDAYEDLDQFYRMVIYKKHKYIIIVDEVKDDSEHKYEFAIGTDKHHFIDETGRDRFTILPTNGSAKLPIAFVEPQEIDSKISTSRPYAYGDVMVDLLKVRSDRRTRNATFFALLYPQKQNAPEPDYNKIYDGGRSGIVVDGDEIYLYNKTGSRYVYQSMTTDARLSYHKDNRDAFEYLAAGATEFRYNGAHGFSSDEPVVAAFVGRMGKIRLGKNLGTERDATITLFYPGATGVLVDGQPKSLLSQTSGSVTIRLSPRQYKTGPTGYEQTVTENYTVEILTDGLQPFVEITRPGGGESWQVGEVEEVRWNSDGSFSQAKLEYTVDGGATWQVVVAGTANDGAYDWTIPDDVSNTCLLRVSDATDGTPADVSRTFAIAFSNDGKPLIHSFTPTSGEPGTAVSIHGDRFSDATDVEFNGVSADFDIQADSVIIAFVPDNASTGEISVSNPQGTALSGGAFVIASGERETHIFYPIDDAQVKLTQERNNYGAKSTTQVQRDKFISYFKFNVTGLNGNTVSARLRLHVDQDESDGSERGGDCYLVSNNFLGTDTPWHESELRAINTPLITEPALGSVGAVSANDVVEFDLGNTVDGKGMYSFALSSSADDRVEYFTKEGDFAPELIVETGPNADIPQYKLLLATSGLGEVMVEPEKDTYDEDDVVELAAIADDGWRFSQWSGDVSGRENKITLAMNKDMEVTARFIEEISGGHTLIFKPIDDAYVRSTRPHSNYGSRPNLRVRLGRRAFRSYLKFEVEGLSGHLVEQALLRLYVVVGSSTGGSIYQVANEYGDGEGGWKEDSLTWQNAPAIEGEHLATLAEVKPGSWVEVDVTPVIQGDGRISFGIMSEAANSAWYSAGEGEHEPELIVNIRAMSAPAIPSAPGETAPELSLEASIPLPGTIGLSPNYPNPFNAGTTIEYALPAQAQVEITIFNVSGQRIRTLVDGVQEAGFKRVNWRGRNDSGDDVASGIYFLRLLVDHQQFLTRTLILQK